MNDRNTKKDRKSFSYLRLSHSGLSVLLVRKVKVALLVLSALPATMLSLLCIVLVPGLANASFADLSYWLFLVAAELAIFITAGTLNYRFVVRRQAAVPHKRWYIYRFRKTSWHLRTNQRIAIVWAESFIATFILVHVALHITNPYSKVNVVQQPYVTHMVNGTITVDKMFNLHAASGPLADALGYYKSGFLIVQNAWFGSYPAPSHDADGIIDDIHKLRFDPTKPYLISGDQFSVLYPRNLGVFYNSLLDYRTAHSQQDWENRQRIYLQSALYALDAFSSAKHITTTIVPISPQGVLLTEVHPGSVASDSLYGIFYAFNQLEHAPKVQTSSVTKQIVASRKADLKMLLAMYLNDVRDPWTGLVKRGVHLASARDGVLRDSSFYDNVILWKTLDLANKLGIDTIGTGELSALHTKIMQTFWQNDAGYFKDDQKTSAYSSDWLITLPTGFLSADSSDDRARIAKIIHYIKNEKLDQPFPLRYSVPSQENAVPFAVKKFVPNYGGDAIWSYWGAQYISLLACMYTQTGNEAYKTDADNFIRLYRQKIVETHGFPETFDTEGNFLQYPVYKSIRQTGWVVQFEQAEKERQEFRH